MSSYCAGCGASLPGGAHFCPACGKAVSLGRLTRPLVGKKLAGVCQGLAMRYGWDVTLIRVIAVLLMLGGSLAMAVSESWSAQIAGRLVAGGGASCSTCR